MSNFWRTWLVVWCWGVGLFGVTLAGAAVEATSGPVRLLFGLLSPTGTVELSPELRFALIILGGISIGWSISLYGLIQAAQQLGRPIWLITTISVLTWFVIDSILSVVTGFALNVVSNLLFTIGYLIPVVRSGVLAQDGQRGAVVNGKRV
jgi:hypothetical protein